MKASYKMTQTIKRLEKKYGKLEKTYDVEHDERNRIGRGFYDYCQLTDRLIQSFCIIVSHDGSYYKM